MGTALDWAVAKCEGKVEQGVYGTPELLESGLHLHYCDVLLSHPYNPSTDWAQGGPIIERENIELLCFTGSAWEAQNGGEYNYINQYVGDAMAGPTPLIAAMRCYVSSKLGDEVEIPEGLLP